MYRLESKSLMQKILCSFISIFCCTETFHKNDCFISTATQSFVSYSHLPVVILLIFMVHNSENWLLQQYEFKTCIDQMLKNKRICFPALTFGSVNAFLTIHEWGKGDHKVEILFQASTILPFYLPTKDFGFYCALRRLFGFSKQEFLGTNWYNHLLLQGGMLTITFPEGKNSLKYSHVHWEILHSYLATEEWEL